MCSGIGMTLLFGSTVIHGLSYILAPPFGLITLSFMGLGSYILSIGIFTSSRELARDSVVRREAEVELLDNSPYSITSVWQKWRGH